MKNFTIFIFLHLYLLAHPPLLSAIPKEGFVRVARIIDPVTFQTESGLTIRYYGVKAFQRYSLQNIEHIQAQLKDFHSQVILGKTVRLTKLRPSRSKQFDPPLYYAYVFQNSKFMNLEILRLGIGKIDSRSLHKLGEFQKAYISTGHEAGMNQSGWWKYDTNSMFYAARRHIAHRPFCRSIRNVYLKDCRWIKNSKSATQLSLLPCSTCMPGRTFPEIPGEAFMEYIARKESTVLFALIALISWMGYRSLTLCDYLILRYHLDQSKQETERGARGGIRTSRKKNTTAKQPYNFVNWFLKFHRRWELYFRLINKHWRLKGLLDLQNIWISDQKLKEELTKFLVEFRQNGTELSTVVAVYPESLSLKFSYEAAGRTEEWDLSFETSSQPV